MNDYIIQVDENGQPYIAHAFGDGFRKAASRVGTGLGRGVRKSHKYIMKVGEGAKARYFYTQEEIRAYQQEMSKKAKGAAEKVKGAATDAKTKMKSTSDRMKEDFRKTKAGAADKLGFDELDRAKKSREKVEQTKKRLDQADRDYETVEEEGDRLFTKDSPYAKKSIDEETRGERARADEYFDKWSSKFHRKLDAEDAALEARIDNKKAEEELDKTAVGKVENVKEAVKGAASKAKEKYDKATGADRSKYEEYTDGDPDFDDDRYSEDNRVGNTDFFTYKRDDGRTVIIEEDMKWVLPEGVDERDPDVRKALREFTYDVEEGKGIYGKKYTNDDWVKGATEAIDEAVKTSLKKKKK